MRRTAVRACKRDSLNWVTAYSWVEQEHPSSNSKFLALWTYSWSWNILNLQVNVLFTVSSAQKKNTEHKEYSNLQDRAEILCVILFHRLLPIRIFYPQPTHPGLRVYAERIYPFSCSLLCTLISPPPTQKSWLNETHRTSAQKKGLKKGNEKRHHKCLRGIENSKNP